MNGINNNGYISFISLNKYIIFDKNKQYLIIIIVIILILILMVIMVL